MSQEDISNSPPPPPPVPSNRPLLGKAISNQVSWRRPFRDSFMMSQEMYRSVCLPPPAPPPPLRPHSAPMDQYLRDLIYERRKEREERRKYLEIYLPLYEASIRCDWKAAKAILDKNTDMELVRCKITENGDTALHIAASAKAPKKKVNEFVRNLVGKMKERDLELVNNNQSTALYLAAAAGNIESVKIMMEKNPTLDTIPGGDGRPMMPLYAAVLFGNKDVGEYLYKCSRNLSYGWAYDKRGLLLEKCVESDMFDIAIQIVKMYPVLGRSNNLLGLLAQRPEAFHEDFKKSSNTESNIIKRIIKSGKHP